MKVYLSIYLKPVFFKMSSGRNYWVLGSPAERIVGFGLFIRFVDNKKDIE